jgi:glutamate synthase (NADPH/NADH) small chain
MEAEGVTFKTKVIVGDKNIPAGINNDATETVSADS